MKFFNGFSLKNEEHFFDAYMLKSDFIVSGFSYGAIKAFEFTCKQLENNKRVDTLQLFSPAFFQSKDTKFKRLQMMSYKRNKESYIKEFIKSCFLPFEQQEVAIKETTADELEELLYYEWDKNSLYKLVEKGVNIEVYLGGEDAIIDAKSTKDFFLDDATVTYIKGANHFLQKN